MAETPTETKSQSKPAANSLFKQLIEVGIIKRELMGPTFCQTIYCGQVMANKPRKDDKGAIVEIQGSGGKRVEFVPSAHPLASVPVGSVAIIRKDAQVTSKETKDGRTSSYVQEPYGGSVELLDAISSTEFQAV